MLRWRHAPRQDLVPRTAQHNFRIAALCRCSMLAAVKTTLRVVRYLCRHPWYAPGTMACVVVSALMILAYQKPAQVIFDNVIGGDCAELLL